ncbi:uncharacterized protein LOC112049730 [Bicyclus anynana]|uniref:Uncharacterized protein LOC112049730 n=1 Tax=Bicyclus anynana TaxID=110368 RepID=A0A6J1NEU3_BICAN|nr:uncharacterized protein LOC112049730 [Bicyclus anynana]
MAPRPRESRDKEERVQPVQRNTNGTKTLKSVKKTVTSTVNTEVVKSIKETIPKTPNKNKEKVAEPSSISKHSSTKKASWKRRPKAAHSGVPVPDKVKKLLMNS